MDRSKSKYDSDLAETLYAETPDESIGSVDELGWAGRFNEELAIIVEDSQGFVWIDEFESAEALAEAWKEIEDTYEEYDYGLLV